jgi:hypothetical protein
VATGRVTESAVRIVRRFSPPVTLFFLDRDAALTEIDLETILFVPFLVQQVSKHR